MTAPAPPTALLATYTTDPLNRNYNRISLSWTASIDTPASYNIYRNGGCPIGNVLSTSPLTFVDKMSGGDVPYFTYYATSVDSHGVEGPVSASICNFSQRANQFITDLRRSLKDSPADPRVQRWTDDDLWLALNQGLSRVNSIPMNTGFNFDTAPPDLFNYIIVASRIAALRSQASLEVAKEFTMGIGGASINLNRTAPYVSLINNEDAAFASEIKSIKLNFTMRSVHGEGILAPEFSAKIRTFAPRQYRIR